MMPAIVGKDFENKSFECSHEEYHNIKDAVHSSSLIHMDTSPRAYKFFSNNPKDPTDAMQFGSLCHGVMLEGDDYLKRYVVMPKFKGFTQGGKETTSLNSKDVQRQVEEWTNALLPGTLVMTQEDRDRLLFMADSILENKVVQSVLRDGVPEYKKQWRDPKTGLKCVSSDDFVSFKHDIWLDFKTTAFDPKWDEFRRKSVEPRRLDFQAAMYNEGLKEVHNFDAKYKLWIVPQSVPPYEVRVHTIDQYYIQSGLITFRSCMNDLRNSIKHDSWPHAQQILEEAGEPSPWFKTRFDAEVYGSN